METQHIDALNQRLEILERANRRWKSVACITVLGVILALALGGPPGPRAVVAQQPEEKAGGPALHHMEYKVIRNVSFYGIEKALRETAAEGWELVQVVSTDWTLSNGIGSYRSGSLVVRRPRVPGK